MPGEGFLYHVPVGIVICDDGGPLPKNLYPYNLDDLFCSFSTMNEWIVVTVITLDMDLGKTNGIILSPHRIVCNA